jgi:predicted permease
MGTFLRRVWYLLNRRRHERELVNEMLEHRGLMHDPATFGDTHRLLERSRDAWGWNWLDDAIQDLRLGIRALKRSPVFTVTAVLMLAFGIGLNLTVFQMAHVVLLRGPNVSRPETLARLHRRSVSNATNSEAVPYVAAMTVARENTALSAVMVEAMAPVVWEHSAVVEASFVSANWFSQIGGGGPLLGRVFVPQIDAAVDAPPVAIVSYRFWTTTLAADPAAIGASFLVNDRSVTVIGVMPETFPELDLDQSAIWLPINQRDSYFPHTTFLTDWSTNNVAMYGRLKDGVTPAQARESLRPVVVMLHREQPTHFNAGDWLEPAMATENFTEPEERLAFIGVASTLGLLSTMVLVVVAANLGNLVMSRATSRARELGVRVALGAGRSRIVRQLAIETLPLGLSGTAAGLLLSVWATNTVAAVGGLPAYLDFTPDLPAIGLSLILMALALAVVGALPAWKISKHDLTDAIKDGGQQISMRLDRARVRSLMLSAQVGGSCLVLIVSAMMVRSLQHAVTADLGFEYEQGAVLQAGLSRAGISGDEARWFWMSVKERVLANPETRDSALALSPPFSGRTVARTRGGAAGYPEAPRLKININHVDPEFFSVLEIPILAGRTFKTGDDPETSVVISRTLAQTMYGTTDVVGQPFPRSEPRDTIIGIAGDTSAVRPGATGVADLYRPLAREDYEQAVLLTRARTDAARLLPILREAARADTRVFAAARLLRDDFERRLSGTRIASSIGSSIGGLTLLLACIGIFGVVSYGVTLRTKEVGIHMALGASRRAILHVVTRQVLSPVLVGMAIGTIAAAPIGLALAQSPLQPAFADPLSYATALVMLAGAGAVAAVTPALRALRTDPIRTLRHE